MIRAATFDLMRDSAGYWYLVDTDTFNNWGRIHSDETGMPFCRVAQARNYAIRCHDFKCGRRMTV
jgi:hypothetical protein